MEKLYMLYVFHAMEQTVPETKHLTHQGFPDRRNGMLLDNWQVLNPD
jgi:hypothetical protein